MLFITGVLWSFSLYENNKNSFLYRIDKQVEIAANSLDSVIMDENPETIQSILATLSVDSSIVYAEVVNNRNQLISADYFHTIIPDNYQLLSTLFRFPSVYSVTSPIFHDGEEIGKLHIRAQGQEVLEATANSLLTSILISIVAFFIASALSIKSLGWLLRPIEQLSALAKDVKNSKNYALRAKKHHPDEVGALTEEFNQMLQMTQERDDYLEREVENRTLELQYQATHDPLTSLPNRRGLTQYLKELIENESGNKEHALLILDLDQFKVVNDTCGHTAGDDLLQKVSTTLKKQIRPEDHLSRIGGDEFAIVLKNVNSESMSSIAEQIRQSIEELKYVWQSAQFRIGGSIGALLFSKHNADIIDLLKQADSACFAAKDLGRNRVYIIGKQDLVLPKRRHEMLLVQQMQNAMDSDDFVLHHQPIVSFRDKHETSHANSKNDPQIAYFEILLRLKNTVDGQLIYPDHFLPAAEKYGLSTKLDKWVIKKTLSHLEHLSPDVKAKTGFWINISSNSLSDEDFIQFLEKTFINTVFEENNIILEITETVFIHNLKTVSKNIERLRALGCRFALDDFGSGASSFTYLKELPLDFIKIDGSFVRNIQQEPLNLAVVESIIKISKLINVQTVAEHIEDDASALLIAKMGVDYGQGYALGYPIALNKIIPEMATAVCS